MRLAARFVMPVYLPAGRQGSVAGIIMKFHVYAIVSLKKKMIYVGMSNSVFRRIKEHNMGTVRSTKAFRPWKLIFSKELSTRAEARREEKKFKSGSYKEYLYSLIKNMPV